MKRKSTKEPGQNLARAVAEEIVRYERPVGDFDIVLGVRRLRTGSFSGLWELTELDVAPGSTVKRVLIDASTKAFVVRKAWEAIRRTV